MNAVLGMADLLAETELSPEQRHYLDIMRSNGHNLTDLINSILDLVRIETGRLQLENVEFDLAELIDRTVSTFAVQAHSKGLELVARIAPETPLQLMGDPLRLRQINANFIANAIKYTEQGGVILEVALVRRADAVDEVRFTVADTGVGYRPGATGHNLFGSSPERKRLPAENLAKHGLGLSIVKRLTDLLMHGKITVASEAWEGQQVLRDRAVRTSLPSPRWKFRSPSPTSSGIAPLVVDDHRINRQMVREALTNCRAEVAEAGTAEEALWSIRYAVAMNKPFQIVLLCARMEGGGMELLEAYPAGAAAAAADHSDVVFGRHSSSGEKSSNLFEIEAYLVKPITHRELCSA